jgi:HEAT repeat protein
MWTRGAKSLDAAGSGGYPGPKRMARYLVPTVGLLLLAGRPLQAAPPAAGPATATPPAPATPSTAAPAPAPALTVAAASGGRLEVKEGGKSLAVFAPRTPAARRGEARARAAIAGGRRVLEVRVTVAGKLRRQEVWLADLGAVTSAGDAAATATPVWQGLVGDQDADGETATDVAIGERGIELFQRASRLTRCDGMPAQVFTRAWDFTSKRWVSRGPALPPPRAQAPVLQARRGDAAMPTGPAVGGFFWTGASSAEGATEVRRLGAPAGLGDADPETAWHAGGAPSGDALGEFLTARSGAGGVAITGLRLLPGDTSDPRAFRSAGRPRRVVLLLGRAPEQQLEVELVEDPDGGVARYRQPFWVPLPKPVVTSCVTVMIREATAGSRPVAISGLDVLTDVDGAGGVDRVIQSMLGEGGAGCEARLPVLVGLGGPALPPTAAAVTRAKPGASRECLVDALDRLSAGAPAAPPPAPAPPHAEVVAGAFAAALVGASKTEEKLVLAAVPRLGAAAVAPLARLLGDEKRAEEDRTRAARALIALGRPDAQAPVIAAAGHRSPGLRAALRDLLAGARPSVAAEVRKALAATAPDATARRGDLLFVLGAAAAHDSPDEKAAALTLLDEAGKTGAPFEVQARVVGALGQLGDEPALVALEGVRRSSADPVLRYLAARELAAVASPRALTALRAALADADPRVRETAALALGQRRDQAAGPALIVAAGRDKWPFARRAAIEALGQLCPAGGADQLAAAAARDLKEVRRAAFIALVRCRDPRARKLLEATLDRRVEPAELRAMAARLLGELGDKGAAPALAEAVKRLRVESQADLALEASAVVAMESLTGFGGKEALGAALALVGDERPVLKRAGIEALGRLCDKSASAALAAAARDTDLSVSGAASAAQRRCQERP